MKEYYFLIFERKTNNGGINNIKGVYCILEEHISSDRSNKSLTNKNINK